MKIFKQKEDFSTLNILKILFFYYL